MVFHKGLLHILWNYSYPFVGDDEMNCIIPFERKMKFSSPIKEVCSISLEHEITQNESEILGNFIISGTYKEHELSVNTTDFQFTIPFSVELTNRIEEDTLEFSIDNFTYDIDGDEMTIKIDYIVCADDEREEIIVEDPMDLIVEKEITPPLEGEADLDEETIIEPEELRKEEQEIIEMPIVKDPIPDEREDVSKEIISSIETENDFVTYHIHMVKEEETIESIILKYNLTKDDLEQINDLTNVLPGCKLIIPINHE